MDLSENTLKVATDEFLKIIARAIDEESMYHSFSAEFHENNQHLKLKFEK